MTDALWTARLRRTLESYDEPLLRQVAGALCRPRNHWPAEELVERSLATLGNAAALDRRLRELSESGRTVLALIAHSRQPRWHVGKLAEMLAVLGEADPTAILSELLQSGLLYPELFPREAEDAAVATARGRLKSFGHWMGQARPPIVLAHPAVTLRAANISLARLECPKPVIVSKNAVIQEADGLEWPLRLAALWQQVSAQTLRRTQQGDFFKRDFDRLQADPILNQPPADHLAAIPDLALFTVALGIALGVLVERDGEFVTGAFPEAWNENLPQTLASIWAALPHLESWNPLRGWNVEEMAGNPYPSAQLLALVALAHLPQDAFAAPADVEHWIAARHPYWSDANAQGNGRLRAQGKKTSKQDVPERGIARFLLGVAYPLRLIEATRDSEGDWLVRLSALGRWMLQLAPPPAKPPAFQQTILVQPNLEILAYRQGLTPALILRLGAFAAWKSLGAACTLQLGPHSVYHALESGETFESIVQTLERHGMRELPAAVLDSLRTWSNKRERLTIYDGAALFEFPGAAELTEAIARGFPAVRLTERLAVVPNEANIDYSHFRLTATRDYSLPAEKCVDVEADGVTLSVDLARSDLLLETEVAAFAEPVAGSTLPGRQLYALTVRSLHAARANGLSLATLENWFVKRTGLPLSPAARLLFAAADQPPVELRRQLVLHVGSAEVADGLAQWPATRALIQARLGATALIIAEKDIEALRAKCAELGLRLLHSEG